MSAERWSERPILDWISRIPSWHGILNNITSNSHFFVFTTMEHADFVTDPQTILRLLTTSKNTSSMVAINSVILGSGTCVTAIKEIILDDDIKIVLSPYDINGHMLDRTTLHLSDIRSVLPFASKFTNPFLKKFAEGKSLHVLNAT
jgi:hypothetical protein